VEAIEGLVDKEFDELWNPINSGLPADITCDLNTPEASPAAVRNM